MTKFSRHFGRPPDRLGLEDVRAFRVYLVSQGISWPALNQTVCALRFFYGVTLDRAEIPERIAYARTPRKLPAILSADEVVRFLEAVPSLKARTVLTTAYAAGIARIGGGRPEGRGYRQQADGDPGPSWQGRQGPHGHAVTATARHFADLLAPGAACGLVVSRTRRQADRRAGAACCLPFRNQGGRIDQEGEHVLAYLGRYTHRVAIANGRLVSANDAGVTFRWRNYRCGNALRHMTLAPHEFIRRFLLHCLPDGFHRIRHYGFLANGIRRARLAVIRQLLAEMPTEPRMRKAVQLVRQRTPFDPFVCPCCGGILRITATLPRARLWRDTS